MATKMKSIEIKKVASANEAVDIISRLNYMNCEFEYDGYNYWSNDRNIKCRHFKTNEAFAIVEIVQNGKLAAVRFYNLYCDSVVELQFGDIVFGKEYYDNFENIIIVDEEILADALTADSDNKITIETKLNAAKEELKDITTELLKETNSDIRDARLRATRRELRDEIAALEAELVDTEADVEDYAVTTEAQDTAIEAEEILADVHTAESETANKIETKHNKNGAILYYVNGKLVSRAIALEAATEKREGNLFTVEIGSWNEETKTVDYKTFMKIAECPVKIQQQAFRHDIGFRVIVSNVEVKTFYAHKDDADRIKKARFEANVLANKIAMAFICGEYGIRLIGGCDIKILEKLVIEADVEDYAVTTEAQDVAVEAEEDFAYMNELRAKHKAYRAEQLAKGNYTLDINGERIIFKNHKAFEIRAWKLGFGYSAERSKTYKFFELTEGGSFYRPASPKRIIDAYAKQLKDEELKSFADKFFAGSNTDKFFLVGCNLKIGKNEYSYRRDFNFFNQAKNFVYNILNNFAGKAEMYIFIQANKKFGKRYFTIDREGYMEENLPLFYSDYAKMSAAELTAKLAELNADIKSQEEEVAYYCKHDFEADEEKQELRRLRLHRDEAEFALHADENRPCEQIVEDYNVTTDAEQAIEAEEDGSEDIAENEIEQVTKNSAAGLTVEQIQKLIDDIIVERTETIDALEEAEEDEEISQTHIDYLKGRIDELFNEYSDLCKQLDAAKAKASDEDTEGSKDDSNGEEFFNTEAEIELANANTADTVAAHEVKTHADNFAVEKARMQAVLEAAKTIFDMKQAIVESAKRDAQKACDAYEAAKKALAEFYEQEANKLNEQIQLPDLLLEVYNQNGEPKFVHVRLLYIAAEEKFDFDTNSTTHFFTIKHRFEHTIYGTYDTPEQAALAIKQLTASEPEPDTDSPEYMLGIINELDTLNANAPDGWQVDFNPVENNFSVAFNGASVADIDSLALAKILPPNKFFDRFKPIIDDDRQEFYREDLPRELDELQAMREQLGDDKERLKTLDELIEQTKREIAAEVLKIPRESPSAII